MTMRMTFLAAVASVPGKRAQSGIALGRATAQARGEGGDERRLEVAGNRNPRDRGEHDRRQADEDGDPEARTAAPHRSCHQLRGADSPEPPPDPAPNRLVPRAEREADRDAGPRREDERG